MQIICGYSAPYKMLRCVPAALCFATARSALLSSARDSGGQDNSDATLTARAADKSATGYFTDEANNTRIEN